MVQQLPPQPLPEDAAKTIRQTINEWKKKHKDKPMPKEMFDGLVVEMDQFLSAKAHMEKCEDQERKGSFQKCSCLSILRNYSYRRAVAQFCTSFLERNYAEQNQTIVDWYRYATANVVGNKQSYLMPYDVSGVDNPEEVAVALQHRTICRSAMMTLVHFGKRRMKTIKSIASRNGVAPRHGNTGKRKRLREDDPKLIAIREHFEILIKLAEDCPRATRIVFLQNHLQLLGRWAYQKCC